MVANDPAAVRGALLCGEGLMLASDIMVKAYAEKGYIRRVLAGWTGPELELNALFPRGQVTSPKVRAFGDFLVERLNLDADYMMTLCPNISTCGDSMLADSASVPPHAQQMTTAHKEHNDNTRDAAARLPARCSPVPR